MTCMDSLEIGAIEDSERTHIYDEEKEKGQIHDQQKEKGKIHDQQKEKGVKRPAEGEPDRSDMDSLEIGATEDSERTNIHHGEKEKNNPWSTKGERGNP